MVDNDIFYLNDNNSRCCYNFNDEDKGKKLTDINFFRAKI